LVLDISKGSHVCYHLLDGHIQRDLDLKVHPPELEQLDVVYGILFLGSG